MASTRIIAFAMSTGRAFPVSEGPFIGSHSRTLTMIPDTSFFEGGSSDWRGTLDHIVETMREMSLQDAPQAMVRAYGARIRRFQKTYGFVALSRRGLEYPKYRITRSSSR